MSDFEEIFGLLSLMFGLIVAELAIKFADAIDSHGERPNRHSDARLNIPRPYRCHELLAVGLGSAQRIGHQLADRLRGRSAGVRLFPRSLARVS